MSATNVSQTDSSLPYPAALHVVFTVLVMCNDTISAQIGPQDLSLLVGVVAILLHSYCRSLHKHVQHTILFVVFVIGIVTIGCDIPNVIVRGKGTFRVLRPIFLDQFKFIVVPTAMFTEL
jgi:hypothetical protein